MSMNWFPVIDRSKCTNCGQCVKFCRNGVYNKREYPMPVPANPKGCIQGCHGCGNRCPHGAITYAGDNTGWKPPHGSGGCGCNSKGCC